MSQKSRLFARPSLRNLVLLFQLFLVSGCDRSSTMVFANWETKEVEVFLEWVESDWNEVRLMSTVGYLLERDDPAGPHEVLEKITRLQVKTMESFENLMDKRKISESQYNRYLKILSPGSAQ